jgi:hypothetical protein
MGRFRRWINDLGVYEIPLHGRKYTWTSSFTNASPTLVWLDRMFCTLDWEDQFPGCLLQCATSNDSDHCPLILGLQDIIECKKRFHFEAFWPSLDGFLEVVKDAWDTVQPTTCPLHTLALKLKPSARGLQSWSQKKFGHFKSQLLMAKKSSTNLILHKKAGPSS